MTGHARKAASGAFAACLLWSGAWAAAAPEGAPAPTAAALTQPDHTNDNIIVVVRVLSQGKERKATLETKSGTQANLKFRDPAGPSTMTINVLPAVDPNDPGRVDAQFQVEVENEAGKPSFEAQGEAGFTNGKAKTLMEAAGVKLSIELSLERPR